MILLYSASLLKRTAILLATLLATFEYSTLILYLVALAIHDYSFSVILISYFFRYPVYSFMLYFD